MFSGTMTAGADWGVLVCTGLLVTCRHHFPSIVPHLMVKKVQLSAWF